MKHIVVTGARSWENSAIPARVLDKLLESNKPHELVVFHGRAPGLDTIVDHESRKRGIWTVGVPALWDAQGRGAGPRRNEFMLELAQPVVAVIAFHWDLDQSKGTADCVERARKKGLMVKLVLVDQRVAMPSVKEWADRKAEKAARRRPRRSS